MKECIILDNSRETIAVLTSLSETPAVIFNTSNVQVQLSLCCTA